MSPGITISTFVCSCLLDFWILTLDWKDGDVVDYPYCHSFKEESSNPVILLLFVFVFLYVSKSASQPVGHC